MFFTTRAPLLPPSSDYYTACDPADLHPPTRLARVLDKLRAEVDQGAIVCLQEVSIAWAGPLHAFFQQRGYSFVTHLYSAPPATGSPPFSGSCAGARPERRAPRAGPAWQGFMGVGVAFDARRFEVVDCDISRRALNARSAGCVLRLWASPRPAASPTPAQDIRRQEVAQAASSGPARAPPGDGLGAPPRRALLRPPPTAAPCCSLCLSARARLPLLLQSTASSAFWAAAKLVGKRPPEDPIEQAKRRVNAMVFLRLREAASGATFGCATYHMPCAFRSPQTMAVHMALCGQRAFALAGTDPFVVCGDFNIQPDSDFYRFFQTGRYERNCPSFPGAEKSPPVPPTRRFINHGPCRQNLTTALPNPAATQRSPPTTRGSRTSPRPCAPPTPRPTTPSRTLRTTPRRAAAWGENAHGCVRALLLPHARR